MTLGAERKAAQHAKMIITCMQTDVKMDMRAGAAGVVSEQEIEKRSVQAEEQSGLESLEAAKEDSQTAVEPQRQENLQPVKEASKSAAETGAVPYKKP